MPNLWTNSLHNKQESDLKGTKSSLFTGFALSQREREPLSLWGRFGMGESDPCTDTLIFDFLPRPANAGFGVGGSLPQHPLQYSEPAGARTQNNRTPELRRQRMRGGGYIEIPRGRACTTDSSCSGSRTAPIAPGRYRSNCHRE